MHHGCTVRVNSCLKQCILCTGNALFRPSFLAFCHLRTISTSLIESRQGKKVSSNMRKIHYLNIVSSQKHTCIILTPLNATFFIVKLVFTGVYIILLISAQKHRLWVLVRTASIRRF